MKRLALIVLASLLVLCLLVLAYAEGDPETKQKVTVTWGGSVFYYNGQVQFPSATAEGYEVEVTPDEGSMEPGTYTAKATLIGADDCEITNPTCAYEIKRIEVEFTWSVAAKYTYNGDEQAPTATASPDAAFDLTYKAGDGKSAGSHTLEATPSDTQHYVAKEGTNTCTYTIEKKPVTISWSKYEGLVFDGAKHVPEAEGDADVTVNVEVTKGDKESTKAGDYTATATLDDPDNYEIKEGATQDYTIAKQQVTITWAGYEGLVFNGKAQIPTAESDADPAVSINVKVTKGDEESKNAGDYTATAELVDPDDNYEIIEGETQDYTIGKQKITLSWKGDADLVYNGEQQLPVATSDADPEVEITVEPVEGFDCTSAGAQEARAVLTDPDNYELDCDDICDYEIEKQKITITWAGYEDLIYNGEAQIPTAESDADPAVGITVKVIKGEEESINAGDYTAEAVLDDPDNYEIVDDTEKQDYTIARQQIKITWAGYEDLIYNGEAQIPTATSDADPEVGITVEVTEGEKESINAGDYTVTAVLDDYDNYEIIEGETQDYTIAKQQITITWDGYEGLIYNGESQIPTAKSNAAPEVGITVEVTEGEEESLNAGDYTVTAVLDDYDNYEIIEGETLDYTIAPCVIKTFDFGQDSTQYTFWYQVVLETSVTVTEDNKDELSLVICYKDNQERKLFDGAVLEKLDEKQKVKDEDADPSTDHGQTMQATLTLSDNFVLDSSAVLETKIDYIADSPSSVGPMTNRTTSVTITFPEAMSSIALSVGGQTAYPEEGSAYTFSWTYGSVPNSGEQYTVTYTDTHGNPGSYAGKLTQASSSRDIMIKLTSPEDGLYNQDYERLELVISGCAGEPVTLTLIGPDGKAIELDPAIKNGIIPGEFGTGTQPGNLGRKIYPQGEWEDGEYTLKVAYSDVSGGASQVSFTVDRGITPKACFLLPFDDAEYITVAGVTEPGAKVSVLFFLDGDEDNRYVMAEDVAPDEYGYYQIDVNIAQSNSAFQNDGKIYNSDMIRIVITDRAGNTERIDLEPDMHPAENVSTAVLVPGRWTQDGESVTMAAPVSGSTELPLLFGAMFDIGSLNVTVDGGSITVESAFDDAFVSCIEESGVSYRLVKGEESVTLEDGRSAALPADFADGGYSLIADITVTFENLNDALSGILDMPYELSATEDYINANR